MKKILGCLIGILSLAGLIVGTPVSGHTQVIKLGHPSHGDIQLPGMGLVSAAHFMKDYIETATQGALKLELHPRGGLGSPRAMMEQCQAGITHMFYSFTAIMVPFCPEFGALQIPYVFNDSLQGIKTMQGPFGKELADLFLKKTGMRILSWPEGSGFRMLLTKNKLVKNPADMKGMKIRVPENPGAFAFWSAMGARPVTITLSEMYTGLQTGVAESLEFELVSTEEFKLFEVVRNATMTNHAWNVHPLLINEKFFRSLSPKHQTVIMRAAEMGEIVHSGYNKPSELLVIQNAIKGGAKFHYPSDAEMSQFKEIGQKAYLEASAKSISKEWVDKIFSAASRTEAEIVKGYQSRIQ